MWNWVKNNPGELLVALTWFALVWSAVLGALARGTEKSFPRASMIFAALSGINWSQLFRGATGNGLENDPSVRAAIASPIAPVEATQAPPKASVPPLPPSTKDATGIGLGVLCLMLVGCVGATDTIARYAETARDVEVFAEGCAVEQKKVDLATCSEGNEACKAAVHEKWEPIADLFDASNKLWCAVSPDSEGCKK